MKSFVSSSVVLALLLSSTAASAATYSIGSSRADKTLQSVLKKLQPGDIVEFDGGEDYAPEDDIKQVEGAAGKPITFRGVAKGGKLPVIRGGDYGFVIHFSHAVFENFELTGQTGVGVLPKGDDIVLRNLYVHDCTCHGVLGADDEVGNLTIEYSHFFKTGDGEKRHQIYVNSDRTVHPGSVFRLHHNYIHDSNGGNNVKIRSERSEVYYNWIEGAKFHELDLIGYDIMADTKNFIPVHHDIVGNVIIKSPDADWFIARTGGDGDGESGGRVRFVNNTIILGSKTNYAVVVQDKLESLEFSNNIITRQGGGNVEIVRDKNAAWVSGRKVGGSNNWVASGSVGAAELTGSIEGTDPMFENQAGRDLRPKQGSPVIDKGTETPAGPKGAELPNALKLPAYQPDPAQVAAGTTRPLVSTIDIGAYEFGSGPPRQAETTGGGGGTSDGGTQNPTGDGGSGGGGNKAASDEDDGCGCRAVGSTGENGLAKPALLGLALAAALIRRRRRA